MLLSKTHDIVKSMNTIFDGEGFHYKVELDAGTNTYLAYCEEMYYARGHGATALDAIAACMKSVQDQLLEEETKDQVVPLHTVALIIDLLRR